MRSLEERFADLIDRLTKLDPQASTRQLTELRKELATLEYERIMIVSHARGDKLAKLSREAVAVLERKAYAAQHPTAPDSAPRHARQSRAVSAFEQQARRDMQSNRSRGIER